MGFKKFELVLLVVLLLQLLHCLHLPSSHAHPHLYHPLPDTAFDQQQNDGRGNGGFSITRGLKREIAVNRRGGGGGGHAGGHRGGRGRSGGAHPNKIIPLYVAGAGSHRQNNQHHGTNKATTLHCVAQNYLILAFLPIVLFHILPRF